MGSTYNRIRTEMLPKTSLPGSAETPREVEGYSFTFQRGGMLIFTSEKNIQAAVSVSKVMSIVFLGESKILILRNFLEHGQAVNSDHCITTLATERVKNSQASEHRHSLATQ